MRQEKFDYCWNKLLDYAKICKVEVYIDDLAYAYAEWSPVDRSIYIFTKKMPKYKIIYNFLHELGHFEEDQRDKKEINLINRSYNKYNDDKPLSLREEQAILNEENRAWENGREIAKRFQIKLGSRYDTLKLSSLETYKHNFKKDREIKNG